MEGRYVTAEARLETAKQIQDASNPCGVCNTLHSMIIDVIRAGGTESVRSDPAIKAVIGKLADLCGISHDGSIYDVLYK